MILARAFPRKKKYKKKNKYANEFQIKYEYKAESEQLLGVR